MGDFYESVRAEEYKQLLSAATAARDAKLSALKDDLESQGGLLSKVWGSMVDWMGAFARSFVTQWSSVLLPLFAPVIQTFTDLNRPADKEFWSDRLSFFRDNGFIDADDETALISFLEKAGLGGGIVSIIVSAILFLRLGGSYMDVLGGTIIQKLNKSYSPVVPPAEVVARTSFIAPELHPQVVDAMKRAGLSEDDIKLMFVSMYATYSPQDVRDLYLRGALTEDQANNRLQEMGFTEARIQELKQLWVRIPTPQDIIRYLAKEVFEPDMIQMFGLMADYPGEQAEAIGQMNGYEPRWMRAEWIAHWQDLGLNFMLEALHRRVVTSDGTKVDANFLDRYMGLIEVPPKLREIVQQTSYSPYTRVDVRRMHAMGVLNDDDLVSNYRDLGYDQEHAANMARFTILYNLDQSTQLSKSDITSAYGDGDLDFPTAQSLLVQIGLSEEMAGWLLAREDVAAAKRDRQAVIETVKKRYVQGMIPEVQARNILRAAGVEQRQIDRYIDTWNIDKTANLKLPSKTDLDKMLRRKIITEDQYRVEMDKLGYSKEYIAWYIQLVKSGE